MERLDKFISTQTSIPRSETKKIIKQGRIKINGRTASDGGEKIDPEKDEIKLDGKPIEYRRHIYIMLNKPKGYVCSTRDGLSPTVLELVPPALSRKGLFPAGRLDKDTEGFVLITDDGELAHKMLSPKGHVPKLYFCTLRDEWDESYPSKFASGMVLEDGEKCLPAQFFPGKDKKEAFVVLSEGMFHQVKRMFEALGNKVVGLKRLQIGALPLDPDLKPGECREILHKEIDKLLEYFVFNCDSLSKNR